MKDNINQIKIAPSILAADFARLGDEVRQADECGAELIHIDVMDGRFVPNLTMGPVVVEAVRRVTDLPLDVHLMIYEPERHIQAFADAGADNITVHIEATPNVHNVLMKIKDLKCTVGIALNPHTPAAALQEILPMVNLVNVMTVNPGLGGQSFIMGMKSKIARIRAMIGDLRSDIDIEVDGGINVSTAMDAAQSGANRLVVGSYLFKHKDGIRMAMHELRNTLNE